MESAAAGPPPFPSIAEIFQAHYAVIARLAAMLGADDPEDVAQEALVLRYWLDLPYAEIAAVMGYPSER
jgi:DNA-directed RNA polymerase specialized sigma24 family protein